MVGITRSKVIFPTDPLRSPCFWEMFSWRSRHWLNRVFWGPQAPRVEKNTKVHAVLRLEPLVQWSYKVAGETSGQPMMGLVFCGFFRGFKKPFCCFFGLKFNGVEMKRELDEYIYIYIEAHLVVAVVVLIWLMLIFRPSTSPKSDILIWRNTLQGKS